jgi:hypothetical protein
MDEQLVRSVKTDALWIAYVETRSNQWPVILSHGFPHDVQAFAGSKVVSKKLRLPDVRATIIPRERPDSAPTKPRSDGREDRFHHVHVIGNA